MACCALLVLLSAVALASAAVTTNTRQSGYTYVSDVLGYSNMTMDLCEIHAAIAAQDGRTAVEIFYEGKHSIRGAVTRAYLTWSSANHTGEKNFEIIMAGRGLDYFTNLFEVAANAGHTAAAAMTLDAIQIKYMMHEWDEAIKKTAAGTTSDASGSPHNLDEAWGIWAGTAGLCGATLFDRAEALSKALGTTYNGQAALNQAMARILSDALFAARLNRTAHVEAGRESAAAQALIYLMQSVHADAYAAALAATCQDAAAVQSARSSMQAALPILEPLAKAYGASMSNLAALQRAVSAKATNFQSVQAALVKIVGKLSGTGIEARHLGAPVKAWFRKHLQCAGKV